MRQAPPKQKARMRNALTGQRVLLLKCPCLYHRQRHAGVPAKAVAARRPRPGTAALAAMASDCVQPWRRRRSLLKPRWLSNRLRRSGGITCQAAARLTAAVANAAALAPTPPVCLQERRRADKGIATQNIKEQCNLRVPQEIFPPKRSKPQWETAMQWGHSQPGPLLARKLHRSGRKSWCIPDENIAF